MLTKNEDSNILHTSTENANESFSTQAKKMPALSVNFMPEVNIPPKEYVTYTKQTQTTQTGTERDGKSNDLQAKGSTEPGLFQPSPTNAPESTVNFSLFEVPNLLRSLSIFPPAVLILLNSNLDLNLLLELNLPN